MKTDFWNLVSRLNLNHHIYSLALIGLGREEMKKNKTNMLVCRLLPAQRLILMKALSSAQAVDSNER